MVISIPFSDIITQGITDGLQKVTTALPIPITLKIVLVIQEIAFRIFNFIGIIDDESLDEITVSKTEYFGKNSSKLWGDKIKVSKGDTIEEICKKVSKKTILITLQLFSLLTMHQMLTALNAPSQKNTNIICRLII